MTNPDSLVLGLHRRSLPLRRTSGTRKAVRRAAPLSKGLPTGGSTAAPAQAPIAAAPPKELSRAGPMWQGGRTTTICRPPATCF